MDTFHKSVLLKETIDGLQIKINQKYIDATLGGGGHALRILELGGVVLGIDVDQDAIDYAKQKIKNQKSKIKNLDRLTIARGNFREIDKIARDYKFEQVSGIVFDLGVSSHQIDKGNRGFSFQNRGDLDMRMDQDLGVKALDLVKILTKGELYEIFAKYGEEKRAWQISNAIVHARSISPIQTTTDLDRIVYPIAKQSRKVFQALRIVVNDELNAINEALPKAEELLARKGRICAISFHSLEDRIVKKSFLEFEREGKGRVVTKKPIVPGIDEVKQNSRAKSAKLRIYEKN
jgi:16S rRNA (cytosine1402-N4)-methyltransferase